MNRLLLLSIALFLAISLSAQASLDLQTAYEKATAHYPLMQDQALLGEINRLQLDLLELSKKPQLIWQSEGPFQSETVNFGENAPIKVNLPLVNLRSYLEGRYLIKDGGRRQAQADQIREQLAVQEAQLQVNTRPVKDQVNEAFFGILLAQAQRNVLETTLQDLEIRRAPLEAGVANGVLLESELTKLEVRQLEVASAMANLQSEAAGWYQVLSALTGMPVDTQTQLVLPDYPPAAFSLQRPEQQLISAQQKALLSQQSKIDADLKPTLSAFARAGLGYPNPLNLFDNNVSPYALVGATFSWNLLDWGKKDLQKQLLTLQAQQLDHQRAAFEQNIQNQEGRFRETIAGLEDQIQRDGAIAGLQGDLLRQLGIQLELGVLTVADYLNQSNAEQRARKQLALHRLQRLQVLTRYRSMWGQN